MSETGDGTKFPAILGAIDREFPCHDIQIRKYGEMGFVCILDIFDKDGRHLSRHFGDVNTIVETTRHVLQRARSSIAAA